MSTESTQDRLKREAEFQDQRMTLALQGEDEFRDKFYFINRTANQKYESLLVGLKGKRVVVVGSSDGGVTPLCRQGVYVEGIDISPVSIDKLSKAIEKEGLKEFGSARVMDAENLDYSERSIDCITCSGVLHHLATEPALRSWARCIKANGEVVMFEPLAFHPVAALFRLITPGMRTSDEHPLRGRDFKLMEKYYESVQRFDYGLFTPICAALAVIPGMLGVAKKSLLIFERIDSAMLKIFPFLRSVCWLTVVRLTKPRDATGPIA